MNIQVIFTTNDGADFLGILDALKERGITPSVSVPAPGQGKPVTAKDAWEESPAVKAFRVAFPDCRLGAREGETKHTAAMRRLRDAGCNAEFSPDWQPTGNTVAPEAAPVEGLDDDDL